MYSRLSYQASLLALLLSALVLSTAVTASADMGQAYRDAEKLDNTTKRKRADSSLDLIKQSLRVALKNLQEAYEKNNIKQINCVKGHLATIKGLLRIAEEAQMSLKEALITGQADLTTHEFVKITMARERAKRAQLLLVGCSGDVNDPIKSSQQTSKPKIESSLVQDYTPSSDDSSVLVYEPIASERPEAISTSE
jgi:hypothetical protein